jgi:hypothetical protein
LKHNHKHENEERADERCEVGTKDVSEENHDAIYELSPFLSMHILISYPIA